MLLVKTKLGISSIHGLGLFAAEDISKGTEIWRYHPMTVQKFSKQNFYKSCKDLSVVSLKSFIDYSYIKEGEIYYIGDNTRFINHSISSNIGFLNSFTEIALKDIHKGEEITENYLMSYDDDDFFNHINVFEDESCKNKVLEKLAEVLNVNGQNLSCSV